MRVFDVNAVDRYGMTALGYALLHGHFLGVAMLLRRGADVNKFNSDPRQRPLWWACHYGDLFSARLLLFAGANVDEASKAWIDVPTALHVSADHGHVELVQLLLDAGADLSFRSERGQLAAELATAGGKSALSYEAKQKFAEVLSLLKNFATGGVLSSAGALNVVGRCFFTLAVLRIQVWRRRAIRDAAVAAFRPDRELRRPGFLVPSNQRHRS